MGRMTAAERREIEAEADRALAAGGAGGKVRGWRAEEIVGVDENINFVRAPAGPSEMERRRAEIAAHGIRLAPGMSAGLPDRWDAPTVEAALFEAGKCFRVMQVGGFAPGQRSGASTWPDIVLQVSKGDYPGDASVRLMLPSGVEIQETDRRLCWLTRYIESHAQRVCVSMRMIPAADLSEPANSWREIGRRIKRHDKTAKEWHAKGCANIARGLNMAREPVAVALDTRPCVSR